MSDEQETTAYYKELDFIRELENRNDNFRDQTLIQLSVGVLAILAAFGKDILMVNTTLSIITVMCLALTILSLIVGFYTTSKMFTSIREKMVSNVQNEKKFYEEYTENLWQSMNSTLIQISLSLFLLSMVFSVVLILVYIGGL